MIEVRMRLMLRDKSENAPFHQHMDAQPGFGGEGREKGNLPIKKLVSRVEQVISHIHVDHPNACTLISHQAATVLCKQHAPTV